MAILDKLMEKKDIQAYCNFRERHLRHESVIALRLVPKKNDNLFENASTEDY